MAKPRSRAPMIVGHSAPLGSPHPTLPKLAGLKCPGCLNSVTYTERSNIFDCAVCGGRFTPSQMQRHVHAMSQVVRDERRHDAQRERLDASTKAKHKRETARLHRKGHDTSVIYFIRFRDAVKVGTTQDLADRMAELPWEEILGVVPGGIHDEVKHHRKLAPYRIHGEWFELTEEVAEYIREVNALAVSWYSNTFRSSGPLPIRRGTAFPPLTDYPPIC